MKLHPRLEGKHVLYIDSHYPYSLKKQCNLEQTQIEFTDSLRRISSSSLLSYIQERGIDMLVIHPEPDDTWIHPIEEVWIERIPIVIMKGNIAVKIGAKEMYDHFSKLGITILDRSSIIAEEPHAFDNAVMDALVASLDIARA